MKKIITILIILLLAFGLVQFIRPDFSNPPVTRDISATVPPEVKAILQKACYDCHSNETNLKWYDKITPVNFLVARHIREGRAALNFSNWDSLSPGTQKNQLFWSLNDIRNGEMPLANYLALHGSARLNTEDIKILENYLTSISSRPAIDTAKPASPHQQGQSSVNSSPNSIADEWNGLSYIKGWQNWKAISTTDRFDNNSMRVIYGNDIAVKAIADNQVNPWPNGTVLAKAAWKEKIDSSGQITPGEFWQVEFMVKDADKYKNTEGWGWGRWRGLELKPYGVDELFVTECTNCHRPMKNNDHVFTYPLHLSK